MIVNFFGTKYVVTKQITEVEISSVESELGTVRTRIHFKSGADDVPADRLAQLAVPERKE